MSTDADLRRYVQQVTIQQHCLDMNDRFVVGPVEGFADMNSVLS